MRRALLLSLLVLLVAAADARACSCIPPDVGAAEGAFVGRVAELSGDRVVFEVEAVVKGTFAPRMTFAVHGRGSSCNPSLRRGQRTGVVLYGDEQAIGLCNLVDPGDLGAPAPAFLLGSLLGRCWAVIGS